MGQCLPRQVNRLGVKYQVYLSRGHTDYQGEISAQESCHIPAHCKSPATTINLITAESTPQIFIGFSFSLLSPFLLKLSNFLFIIPGSPMWETEGEGFANIDWVIKYFFPFIVGCILLSYQEGWECLQWGQFISIGRQRGRRAVIDAQWHCSWLSTWCPPPLTWYLESSCYISLILNNRL